MGGQLPSLAPPRQPVVETGRWDGFGCLDAGSESDRLFKNGSEPTCHCRQLEPNEADIMGALDRALGCVIEATGSNEGELLIMDDPRRDLIFAQARGDAHTNRLLWQRLPAGRGVARRPAGRRRAAIVDNESKDERLKSGADVATDFRPRSHISAPLFDGDEVLGVIEVFDKKNGECFSLGDQNHLTVLAHLVSPILIQLRHRQTEKLIQQ